jgi:hypothetical protein
MGVCEASLEARLARAGSKLQGRWEPVAYLQNFPGGSMAAPSRPALSLYGRPAPLTRPFYAWPHPTFLYIPNHRRGAGVYIRFLGQVASLRN